MANTIGELAKMYVPLPRTLVLGMTGKDVAAMQGALKRAHCRPYAPTGSFAAPTRLQVKKFQVLHDVPQTGLYGPNTHAALIPYMSEYERHLFNDVNEQMHPTVRHRVLNAAWEGYLKRDQIHYTEGPLRMSGVRKKILLPNVPPDEDCSSFATWCYWVAGAPDPNGFDYNGYGNTGSQYPRGKHVTFAQARMADIFFYGWSNGEPEHEAIYAGNGMVISNGSEGGPYYEKWDYRDDLVGIRSYLP